MCVCVRWCACACVEESERDCVLFYFGLWKGVGFLPQEECSAKLPQFSCFHAILACLGEGQSKQFSRRFRSYWVKHHTVCNSSFKFIWGFFRFLTLKGKTIKGNGSECSLEFPLWTNWISDGFHVMRETDTELFLGEEWEWENIIMTLGLYEAMVMHSTGLCYILIVTLTSLA